MEIEKSKERRAKLKLEYLEKRKTKNEKLKIKK